MYKIRKTVVSTKMQWTNDSAWKAEIMSLKLKEAKQLAKKKKDIKHQLEAKSSKLLVKSS